MVSPVSVKHVCPTERSNISYGSRGHHPGQSRTADNKTMCPHFYIYVLHPISALWNTNISMVCKLLRSKWITRGNWIPHNVIPTTDQTNLTKGLVIYPKSLLKSINHCACWKDMISISYIKFLSRSHCMYITRPRRNYEVMILNHYQC